jgi:hypothetical protein
VLAFFLSLLVCPLLLLSLVRWLVALLHFLVLVCVSAKNANRFADAMPPKALAYSSVVLLFIKSSANGKAFMKDWIESTKADESPSA